MNDVQPDMVEVVQHLKGQVALLTHERDKYRSMAGDRPLWFWVACIEGLIVVLLGMILAGR